MKSSIALPFLTYLSLTVATPAAPTASPSRAAPAPEPKDLNDQQWAALRSYGEARNTDAAMSSVNVFLATASVNGAQITSEQSSFRVAALATPKPELPAYVQGLPEEQKAYMQNYYVAQASLIQKAADPKATDEQQPQSNKSPNAQILPDVTGSATTTPSANSSSSSSSAAAPPTTEPGTSSSTNPPTSSSSPSGSLADPGSSNSSSASASSASTAPTSSSSSASSSAHTGAAAQQTAMAKVAGLGMGIVAGVAAFL